MPEIWGSYGWERSLPDGDYSSAPVQTSAFEALATAEQWVADIERLGARCERKPTALAFHWRGLAKERVVEIHSRILEKWTTLAAQQELGWHDFDGGIEFRARGWDKGEAVKRSWPKVARGPPARISAMTWTMSAHSRRCRTVACRSWCGSNFVQPRRSLDSTAGRGS